MGKKVYFVSIHTADKQDAGTDCKVFIKLGDGDFVQLDNKNDNFERNAYDSFAVSVKDVGDVTNITLKLTGNNTSAPDWVCDYVVVSSYDYKTAKFNVDNKFQEGEEKSYFPNS